MRKKKATPFRCQRLPSPPYDMMIPGLTGRSVARFLMRKTCSGTDRIKIISRNLSKMISDIRHCLRRTAIYNMILDTAELYKGYVITYVAKVTRNSEVFWIINLEGIKDFVIVRLEQDSLQEVRRIDKAEN